MDHEPLQVVDRKAILPLHELTERVVICVASWLPALLVRDLEIVFQYENPFLSGGPAGKSCLGSRSKLLQVLFLLLRCLPIVRIDNLVSRINCLLGGARV